METFSFEQIIGILRKHIRLIIWTMVAVLLVDGLVTFFVMTPQYEASTQILVNRKTESDPNSQLNQVQADVQMINTYKDIILGPVILKPVAHQIGGPFKGRNKYKNLQDEISISNQSNSQVFSINVKDDNAYRAADIANETAQVFKNKVKKLMSGVNNVQIISDATVNTKAVSPRKTLNLLIGLIFGFVLGVGFALIRELTDKTVKDETFLTETAGLTSLGIVYNIPDKDMEFHALAKHKSNGQRK